MNDLITSHAIQGVPVVATYELDSHKVVSVGLQSAQDYAKHKMAEKLAEEIINNRLAEFTMLESYATNKFIFRARAYMLPNTDVFYLRNQGIIK